MDIGTFGDKINAGDYENRQSVWESVSIHCASRGEIVITQFISVS